MMATVVLEIDSDIEEVACKDAFEVELDKQLSAESYPAAQPLEDDAERLPRESLPFPPLPDPASSASGGSAAQLRQTAEREAAAALQDNDLQRAVDAYTLAMRTGGATSMMLANRAALLLKQKRPCAAIRDCTAALKISSSFVKAYRIRAIAHRKLGHWLKGHTDIAEAQKLKFDEETGEILTFLAAQCRKVGAKLPTPGASSPSKRQARVAERAFAQLDAPSAPLARAVPAQWPVEALKNFDKGQAVLIFGLQNSAHLNGLRGVIERADPRPASKGRWEVELRLEAGKVEIKSLKCENIKTLSKVDRAACKAWAAAEKLHKEQRTRFQDQEEQNKLSRVVEAKMSKYSITSATRQILSKLSPQDALKVLDKVDGTRVTNVNEFVAAQVKLLLDMSDSDDDDDGGGEPDAKRPKT
mmetsp:Transcript_36288/g.104251  ORF Transcript_36288/g.104251 Transcript_36288/m.104251 type:complete len:415 (+) Transcript_36288:88-1332(+)